jgi:hypothetical protein
MRKSVNSRLIGFKFGIADKSKRFASFPLDFVAKHRAAGGDGAEHSCRD